MRKWDQSPHGGTFVEWSVRGILHFMGRCSGFIIS